MKDERATYATDVETYNGLATGHGFANHNGAMLTLFLKREIPWKDRHEAADDLAALILSQIGFLQPEGTEIVPNTPQSR